MHDLVRQKLKDVDRLRRYTIETMIFAPHLWKGFPEREAFSWQSAQLSRAGVAELPDDKFGVYTFVLTPPVAAHPNNCLVIYVGKAENQSLRKRVRQYFSEYKRKNCRLSIATMLGNWRKYLTIVYTETSAADAGKLESELHAALVPPYNDALPAGFGPIKRAVFR